MNIAKHMEFIFIGAIALVSASTLANAAVPAQRAVTMLSTSQVHAAVQAPATSMAVVTITGKRLSAAQKAALGN
jgi:hypothetical protein